MFGKHVSKQTNFFLLTPVHSQQHWHHIRNFQSCTAAYANDPKHPAVTSPNEINLKPIKSCLVFSIHEGYNSFHFPGHLLEIYCLNAIDGLLDVHTIVRTRGAPWWGLEYTKKKKHPEIATVGGLRHPCMRSIMRHYEIFVSEGIQWKDKLTPLLSFLFPGIPCLRWSTTKAH